MKIRPTETGDTDEGEKEKRQGSTSTGAPGAGWVNVRVTLPPHCHHFHVAFSSSVTSLISLLLLLQPQHPVALSRVQPHIMTMFYHLQRSHLQGQHPLQLLQVYEPWRQCVFPKQFNSLITHSHTLSLSHTLANVFFQQQLCVLTLWCFCLHRLRRSIRFALLTYNNKP